MCKFLVSRHFKKFFNSLLLSNFNLAKYKYIENFSNISIKCYMFYNNFNFFFVLSLLYYFWFSSFKSFSFHFKVSFTLKHLDFFSIFTEFLYSSLSKYRFLKPLHLGNFYMFFLISNYFNNPLLRLFYSFFKIRTFKSFNLLRVNFLVSSQTFIFFSFYFNFFQLPFLLWES